MVKTSAPTPRTPQTTNNLIAEPRMQEKFHTPASQEELIRWQQGIQTIAYQGSRRSYGGKYVLVDGKTYHFHHQPHLPSQFFADEQLQITKIEDGYNNGLATITPLSSAPGNLGILRFEAKPFTKDNAPQTIHLDDFIRKAGQDTSAEDLFVHLEKFIHTKLGWRQRRKLNQSGVAQIPIDIETERTKLKLRYGSCDSSNSHEFDGISFGYQEHWYSSKRFGLHVDKRPQSGGNGHANLAEYMQLAQRIIGQNS